MALRYGEEMIYRILKEDEYEKNKYILPNPGRKFWIESGRQLEVKKCGFVNEEGVVDRKGTYCSDTTLWMRPVIEYEKDEQRDAVFTEGQQVILYGLEWTAVSDDVLVCDRCVEESKFDDHDTDFDNSYLKYAIYQYMKRRSAEEAFNPPKSLGDIPDSEIEVDEDEFSYSFLSNLICIFLAAAAGIVCTLSFSPISVSVFALVVVASAVIMGKYNVRKIKEGIRNTKKKYRKKIVEQQTKVKEISIKKSEHELSLEGIEDASVKAKAEEINNLLKGLMKTGNKTASAKVKFFYLPETQKTLEMYHKIAENGIDTPNSRECLGIISENLDKTIKLLKIEYDKAASDDLLDAQLSSGVIGKMLDDAVSQENNKLQMM